MSKTRAGFRSAVPDTQLDLFSDTTEPLHLDNLAPERTHAGTQRTNAARTQDPEALEQVPAENGREADSTEPAASVDIRSAGVDGESALRSDRDSQDGLSPSLGTGDEGMGIPSGRGGSTTTVFRSGNAEPEPTLARDFRLTPAHGIGEGSLREKAHANIDAIRALKKIEAECRSAKEEEKTVLAKYAGWGAMPGAFEPRFSREWQDTARQLREVLSPDEYASARASTPNAHYTSPEVISAVWQAMERFGLQAGTHVLEPSIGVGHFFGLMPEGLLPGSRRTGIELNSVSARMLRSFTRIPTSRATLLKILCFRQTFDATVGNIPFGNSPVFDPAFRRSPRLTRAVHDYFLAKCTEVVRPGGLIALITSRYTMDKEDPAVRQHRAQGADLLGAIRLPNARFRANAKPT